MRACELQNLSASGRWEEALTFLASLSLTKRVGRGETAVRLKEAIDGMRKEASSLEKLFLAFTERELRADLHDLLGSFQKAFHEKKRAAGLVSFADVARMAVIALRDNPSLREHYKGRFRFIMIDEFQDNNHLQKELLFLLAEKRTLSLDRVPGPAELEPDKLFFVGDEKQSIYGFRGAEVDVFKTLQRELAAQGGSVVSLSRNYRSRPGLIAFFNRLFARVMEKPEEDFEAGFEALTPAVPPGRNPPEVTLFYKYAADCDPEEGDGREFDDAESEAFAIASYVRDTVEVGSLPLETASAPVRPATATSPCSCARPATRSSSSASPPSGRALRNPERPEPVHGAAGQRHLRPAPVRPASRRPRLLRRAPPLAVRRPLRRGPVRGARSRRGALRSRPRLERGRRGRSGPRPGGLGAGP